RLSFGPDDATFIDTDATLLFDAEGDDVRAVLEFANIQLLEMRFLDQQLDDVLDRAYELLQPPPTRIGAPGRDGPDLRRLARLQLLEWIIIVLIAVSIILSVVPVLPRH